MVPPSSYGRPEPYVRDGDTLRCVKRFLEFFGVVEVETESEGLFDRIIRERKTLLLDQAVAFQV
jgi:hypothetical protein